jgi:hypothetical protein
MQITTEHLKHALKNGNAKWREKYNRVKHRWGPVMGEVAQQLEIAAAASVCGVVQGRAGEKGTTVARVPLDLAAGVALSALGHANFAGKHSSHLVNIGTGFLAGFMNHAGFAVGVHWRETGKFSLMPGHDAAQLEGTKSSGDLSADDMAAIVANMRAAQAQGVGV